MSDYNVHKAWIEEAEYEILVLEIPNDEIEDKLAYLARDKGNITKSFYEDFIISTCVANINQLLAHIRNQNPDLLKIREEVVKIIIEINPGLDPDNLIINRNAVIKMRGKRKKLKDGERKLTDNKSWSTSYYEELLNEDEEGKNKTYNPGKKKKTPKELVPLDDLSYTVKKVWWKRINKYVEIKQFEENYMESILNKKYFHNRASFQTYISTVCVVDSEDLLTLLDNMGIPQMVSAHILMRELYEMCKEVNPFLTYENAKDFIDDNADESEPPKRGKMTSHAKKNAPKKKKNTKRFKDVTKDELLNLANAMKVFLVGQDEAVDNIVDAIQRASVGLKDPIKPIGSFLFAGRTGIGKTLATKVLADELIKDRDNLVTIDCSEYSADHEYAKLIGAPSGYVGHEQGGILTNAIIETPFSVVVFDEIEKASHKVHELMLQILEEGRLTDGKGTHVSFKDTVIILTSNIGVKEVDEVKKSIGFGDVAVLTEEKKDKAINQALKGKFKPEFLNRIDAIVNFRSLKKQDYMRIIDLELYKLNENLKNNDTEYKDLKLEFDKRVKNLIYREGIDEEFGARPLKRYIEKGIATPLAQKLLKEKVNPNSDVKISAYKNKATFKVVEREMTEEELFNSQEYKDLIENESF
jgi:ATP-dependent Clp protease ATP-binding subunit ClpA